MLDEGRLVIGESAEKLSEEGAGEDVPSQLLQQVVETLHNKVPVEERDALTGLLSRSAGEVQIAEAIQDNMGCLAFVDVDNLKRINDTMGHKAGDRLLMLVGAILSECAKNSVVCRLGV